MPRASTSAKGARRRPRSPNKTPKKQTKLVDFTSRRSNAGSSSSPAKPSSPAKASYHRDESSETELATDASSDVNEVQFEKPGAPTTQRKKVIESSDEDEKKSEQDVIDLASTDDEEEKVVVKKARKGKAKQVIEESEEEEVEPVKRGGKRKVVTLSLTPSSASEEERKPGRVVRRNTKAEEEEEESEEDIMDGLDEHVVLGSRLRSAPTRNSKMMQMRENLARLKRRKLGQDTPPVHSESGSSESEQAEEEAQIVRPRGRRVFKPIPGAQPTLQDYFENSENSDSGARSNNNPKRGGSDGEEDDGSDLDSWIEDDGGEANVPVLPEGYSMLGHQSLAHHFKVVMQLFVHLACMKAKNRRAFRADEKNDQYFGLSLRALSRKLDGMRDSLVVSSAWTPQFKKALNSHPELTIFHLDFAVPGCGACRISTRMSTRRGVLDGDDYDRDTFEPVVKDEESDDDDDEEELPTSFDLGRFCQARVRCYHNFVHWEWQLFESIHAEIEVLRTAALRRDPAKQDRPAADDPDGIMAWLDRRGIVEQEWHRLEGLMEDARGLEFRKGNEDE